MAGHVDRWPVGGRPSAPPRRAWRVVTSGAAVSLMAAVLLGACGARQATDESLGQIATQPVLTTTVREIAGNPQQFVGRVVTVSGEVNRVFGPRWFSIGGGDFEGGGELLVLGRSAAPALLSTLADSGRLMNDIVQVTGVVRTFDKDAIERETGTDLEERWWVPFERQPVVVMTDLDITPRLDVTPAVAVPVPVPVPVAVPIVREIDIINVPDRTPLAGRAAALFNVRVDSVINDRAFWVGQSAGQRLLVVMDSSAMNEFRQRAGTNPLRAGSNVAVAGVIQRMPQNLADVRGDWNLPMSAEAAVGREQVYLSANYVSVLPAERATGRRGMNNRMPVQKDPR